MADYNVWFTADLHIGHQNIIRHQKERIEAMKLKDENDIEGHDEYIIKTWLEQTKRNDHIYVLGDFIMEKSYDRANSILNRLKGNGCKIHLILGNHDSTSLKFKNMFEQIIILKSMTFKKSLFPFLADNLEVEMCHYPMKSWKGKCKGVLQLYGHVHRNSLWIDESDDLCLNVGIDNPLCNYKLFSLEQVNEIYMKKLNGLTPKEYSDKVCEKNKFYIR